MGTRIFRQTLLEGQALLGRRAEVARLYPAARDELTAGNVVRSLDLRLIDSLAGLGAAAAGHTAVAAEHFTRAR
jgi:hypothetical protein